MPAMPRFILTLHPKVNEMNEQLAQALKNFHEAIKKESADDVVSVNVFFNCQGCHISINTRTSESLRSDGESMRNLRGEWVK